MQYSRHEHDVLIIGSGGAGLRAAIEASASGASVGAALGAGNRATARHYAWTVFRARPHSPKSWALLCRALLGVRFGALRRAFENPWLAVGGRHGT